MPLSLTVSLQEISHHNHHQAIHHTSSPSLVRVEGAMTDSRSYEEGHYDAILIGSGIGSMTTAVALAKQKQWRVLILEQHTKVPTP